MLMRPNKADTAVHGCHCPGDMAVRMYKVLARPWVGVRVSLALLLELLFVNLSGPAPKKRPMISGSKIESADFLFPK